jgi:hypothetical protein
MSPIRKAIILGIFSVIGLFVTCRLQAQTMYLPMVIDTQNVGTVNFDSAHVIHSGDQVYVFGKMSVAWNFTGRRNRVVITVPVPTDFSQYVFLTGQMSVHDNGFHDPEGGNVIVNGGSVMFEWWARINTASVIDYYFVYTIKQLL